MHQVEVLYRMLYHPEQYSFGYFLPGRDTHIYVNCFYSVKIASLLMTNEK